MKKLIVILHLIVCSNVFAQNKKVDSLRQLLSADNDTLNLVINARICYAYENMNSDSFIHYSRKYLDLTRKLNYKLQEADALCRLAFGVASNSDGLEFLGEAQRIIEEDPERKNLPELYQEILGVPPMLRSYSKYSQRVTGRAIFTTGVFYWGNKKNNKAIQYFRQAQELGKSLPDSELLFLTYLAFGIITENSDSAIAYLKNSLEIALQTNDETNVGNIENILANKYSLRKDYTNELYYLKAAIKHNIKHERQFYTGYSYLGLAKYYSKVQPKSDSALYFGKHAFASGVAIQDPYLQYDATKLLFEIYKISGNKDSALRYVTLMIPAREKMSGDEEARRFEAVDFNKQLREAALKSADEKFATRLKMYGLLAGLFVFLLLAIIFWKNNQRKKKEYALLQNQKAKTDKVLQDLRSTQSQLIQKEKMASLGELTAGIAHEIQNPLNFVNNFSEVNTELISELVDEADKGNTEEVKLIANDIKQNLEKINHHGKRADGIVKGMLQHSRTSTGQKEPTDINALADEYLRLSYHGMRAKDKSFNATIQTDFDNSIGKINIIPQDIGRVLLNLYNNAFYAVNEKAASNKPLAASYEPTVTVSIKKLGDRVEIRVSDNGNGIPQNIVDKIFQPFFTTKPTGQGTGLGLSLAYDIIKAHGGELNVRTKESEATEMIIQLPIV